MTDKTDIVNLALQTIGTRTTVTASELANGTSNEAIQANLIYDKYRDELLRMAPWDCALKTANLTYITSSPGTPENTSPATSLWRRGQPAPPWAYEYQYPVDCIKACWIVPAANTGFSSSIPITTAVTGGPVTWWRGPPIKFKVAIDTFYAVTAVSVATAGSGYAVGDILQLAQAPAGSPPYGAPVLVEVLTVDGSGGILTAQPINQVRGSATPVGGSYFAPVTGPQAVAVQYRYGLESATGSGAAFNLTFATASSNQRVILTNQENAALTYVRQVTDPNVMDDLFLKAWVNVLGAGLCMALIGDKDLANGKIALANAVIEEARKADGNEGLTVNDVTPDWLRGRGIVYPDANLGITGPNYGYDWGGLWTSW